MGVAPGVSSRTGVGATLAAVAFTPAGPGTLPYHSPEIHPHGKYHRETNSRELSVFSLSHSGRRSAQCSPMVADTVAANSSSHLSVNVSACGKFGVHGMSELAGAPLLQEIDELAVKHSEHVNVNKAIGHRVAGRKTPAAVHSIVTDELAGATCEFGAEHQWHLGHLASAIDRFERRLRSVRMRISC